MEEVNQNYKKFKLSEVLLLVFVTMVIGFIFGLSTVKLVYFKDDEKSVELDDYLVKFVDNYNYVVDNYYGELDKDELISNAISAMLESIDDPYTTYIDESGSNVFNTTLEGSFQGIGVEVVNDSDNNIIVYNVIDDSPASKAGIQKLDIIKSVNDIDVEGMTTSDFVSIIKNSRSEFFDLVVFRNNENISLNVKRELVTIKSVSREIFERENKKIGYLYISIFANNTFSQFKKELENLENENIDGLIIDVRSNTGGHLTAVENILGLFLDKTHVIYQTEDQKGVEVTYSRGNITKSYPITVLVNEASASASEILSAALKEEYNAVLVGKKTFGKGTVQELKTLPDGSQYKFTTKKWLTPSGVWINGNGIDVDVDVDFNKEYYDNPVHDNDVQLQEAINTLL